MARGDLPVFPTFSVHADPNTTSIRWKKWMDKLENLFVALDIDIDKKRKTTLLHYVGDEGAPGEMVIVVGNGHGDRSSKPGRD